MTKSAIFRLALLSCLLSTTAALRAQEKSTPAPAPAASAPAKISITATTAPLELARAAYLAQGGDKYRDLKSLVLSGSVDLYGPNSVQALPGKFVLVVAGERSRLEIQSAVFNYRQISDGVQTFSSVRGMELPAPNKFGINVLMKFDQPGYVVSALPDNKKQRAFRITNPDGQATDFYLDPASGRVMSYLIPYQGYLFGVENKSLKELNGILIPYGFVQRLETPQGAFFAEYKVKDAKIDQAIADDVFEMPAK